MTDDDKLVAAYLRRLGRATRGLPRARRQELIDEIAEHIAQARAPGTISRPGGSAALRNVLEQLGEPRDIAAAAGGAVGAGRPGRREIAAVTLLLIGGIAGLIAGIFGLVGWVTGAVLLWASPRWRWPDKLLGTLVWPGGLAAPLLLLSNPASVQTCSGGSGVVTRCTGQPGLAPWLGTSLAIVSLAVPFLVAIWLLRRARRVPDPGKPPLDRLIES